MEKKINQEAKTFNVGEQVTETQEVKCIEQEFNCGLCEDGERLIQYQTCPKCKHKRKKKGNPYDNCIACKTPVCYGEDFELAMNGKGLPICPDCQKREPFNIYKTCNQIIDEHKDMTFFLETGEVNLLPEGDE